MPALAGVPVGSGLRERRDGAALQRPLASAGMAGQGCRVREPGSAGDGQHGRGGASGRAASLRAEPRSPYPPVLARLRSLSRDCAASSRAPTTISVSQLISTAV